MKLLPFHPFASTIYPTLDDSLFFSGKSNGSSSWGQPPILGIRLQQESDDAFVYAIDSPGIQSDDKWHLKVEKTKHETIIRLRVVGASQVVSDRRLVSVGSNVVDAGRITGKLSDHILTITVPKKQ